MSGAFAELFVSLGIKGSEKTLNVLSTVKTGMGGIRDVSLEAKAAILAAIYALEKMTMGAANSGYEIKSLATYLDIGTKSLQQWRYAALQAGISNQEFDQSAKAVQNNIKQFAASQKLPTGSDIIAQETHFKFSDKFKVDDIFPKLLEFARNKKYSRENIETILEAWGLTPNEISQAIIGKFTTANLNKAPILKDNELSKLSNITVEWANLEAKVKLFMAHLTAKDGEEAVKNLNHMADSVFRIANDIERISTKLGVFKIFGDALNGWDMLLGGVADAIEGKRDKNNALENAILPSPGETNKLFSDINSQYKLENSLPKNTPYFDPFENFLGGSINNIFSGFKSTSENLFSGFKEAVFDLNHLVAPSLPSRYSLPESKTTNTVNQNITFQHPGIDAHRTKEDISKHVIAALRMIPQGRPT